MPTFGSNSPFVKGWLLSGFFQAQSGTPFTVFAAEPEIANVSQFTDLVRGSGGLYRLGFGRPNLICPASQAIRGYSTDQLDVIDRACFSSPLGGFGNLGRNTFRGPMQHRFDLSFVKNTKLTERFSLEIGFDIFNLFDTVNLANPNNDLQDTADFGKITQTTGGPRVGQFRAKFKF